MSNIDALATQENGSLRPFTDTLSKRLLGLRGSPSEEDIRSALLHTRIMTSPPRYGSSIWAQYEKAVKEGPLSTEFIHNLQQLLSIPDTSFAAKYAGNTLKTMFGGQISNRIESVPADGFLRLENGKILSEMEFANDQVSQASFMMPNSTRVVMLDDPKAVDEPSTTRIIYRVDSMGYGKVHTNARREHCDVCSADAALMEANHRSLIRFLHNKICRNLPPILPMHSLSR